MKRFKDKLEEYTYDKESEKRCYPWYIKIFGFIAVGLVLTTFLLVVFYMMKIVHDIKYIWIAFGITIVYCLIFKIIYDKRVPKCSTCGNKMKPLVVDKPKEDFTKLEMSMALENDENDTVYFSELRGSSKPTIYRVKKKVFVCTRCKAYIMAVKEIKQTVGHGHCLEDLKGKRMKRGRRYRESHKKEY